MDSVAVAVVGLGSVGNRQAEVFATEPGSRLVAACDRHPEKRHSLQRRWPCRTYETVEEMLAEEEPDLVSICTGGLEGGSSHFEPVVQALAAGAHVLVEKPLSNRVDQASTMVRMAAEKDLVLAVNLNHRFVEMASRARAWIEEGRLGDILLVNFQLWVHNRRADSPYVHLRELHPHSFDVVRYFCGEIDQLQAFFTHPPQRPGWSSSSINIRFASGAIGAIQGGYDMSIRHQIERCEIAGSAARLVLDNVFERLVLYPHGSDEATVVTNPILGGVQGFYDTFRCRIRTLLDELRAGTRPVTGSGADGLVAQQLAEAAILSFESGAVVSGAAAASCGELS